MKFNWKANWEILLVLVIIVIGIVITTIAAIRNKDKHLLTLSEETDYGQLLANGAAGSLSETGGAHQDQQQQQQQQHHHHHRLHHQTTNQPSLGTSPAAETPQQQVPQASSKALSRHTTQSPFRPIVRDTSGTTSNHRDYHQVSQNHHESRQRPQLTRYDDNADYNRAQAQVNSLNDEQQPANGAGRLNLFGDHYEPASTESIPAQVRSESPALIGPFLQPTNGSQQVSQGFAGSGYQSAGSRRHTNRTQPNESEIHLNYSDSLSDQIDLMDDIHTTRSSLAGDSVGSSQQKKSNQLPDLSSTLSLQAPYGTMSANSMNQLGQLLMQSMNANNKVDPDSTILNPEDVLFGRAPPNANLTEALLNDYSMAALGTANLTANQQQQLMSPAMLANLLGSLPALGADPSTGTEPFGQQTSPALPPPPASTPSPGNHRAFSSLSPISLIINDLLKMARPHQHNDGRLQNGGGILHHSRLPGSLLSLLQGSPLAGSNAPLHTGEAQNFHDASESSQHYQRVSMSPTDIQSILAHSLLGSSVLPAFPPPKGAPQSWIPPTSGGSSDYNLAQNSNADFVINNVAGFLRSSQKDSAGSPTQNQYDQSSYQRQPMANQQQVGSFFAPADNTQTQQLVAQQQQQQQQLNQQQQQSEQAKVDQQQHLASIGTNQASGSAPTLWTQTSASPTGRHASGGVNDKVFRSTLVGQGLQHQGSGSFTNYQMQVHPSSQQKSNMNVNSNQQYQAPSSTLQSAVPVYNSRIVSEIPVPLGYNPPSPSQQQQVAALPNAGSHVEPNLRQGVVAGHHKQQQTQLINKVGTVAPSRPSQQTLQPKSRRKRGANGNKSPDEKERVDEVMSSRYGASDEEDDDTDSRPISVVRPDGRPMNSGRVRGFSIAGKTVTQASGINDELATSDRQVAQSQRSANHLGMKRQSSGEYRPSTRTRANHHRQRDEEQRGEESNRNQHDYLNEEPSANSIHSPKSQKCRQNGGPNVERNQLDVASSGLMSKLLGTASTNDELEEELDDDEDPSSEKRKEEIDDAEFGLVNDDRQRGAPESNSDGDSSQVDGKLRADGDSGLGSGSTDNESYMRRNQQRSDIEFYGHPGEETRQLKYGILGSGNYEVVNGGIYPEADESTAAVNSVANYVRKPGQSGLLSAVPKLLGVAGASEPGNPQSAYMPGGRVGGFMRGASEHSNGDGELVGLVPAEEAAVKEGLNSPLLELIEANGGQLFDPSLLAQLGSSGSSARSTHTSQEQSTGGRKQQLKMTKESELGPQERPSGPKTHRGQTKFRNSLEEELAKTYDGRDSSGEADQRQSRRDKLKSNEIKSHPSLDRQQSLISGSRSQGTNQFNSYQLLPSKKVTIFSDQDLDSAPTETRLFRQRSISRLKREYPHRLTR